MVIESVAILAGSWLADLGKDKVGEMLMDGVEKTINPSDVQKFLENAIRTANQQESLFKSCAEDGWRGSKRFVSSFCSGRALPELQKPLNGSGKPDAELLRDLFWHEVQNDAIGQQLKEENVLPWMTVFVETYFGLTNSCFEIQRTRVDYCQKLSQKIGKLVFDGMAVDGKVVSESGDLTKIFVMPDVEQHDGNWTTTLDDMPPDIALDDQQRILWEQRQQALFIQEAKNHQAAQQCSAADLLKTKEKQQVVLLGAPGAGKTTLMNYWLVTSAQQCSNIHPNNSSSIAAKLPILVRIRDLARKPELSILDFVEDFVQTELGVEEVPSDFFEHWLTRGEALVLFDGLDEVPDPVQRRKTVEKIELFVRDYGQCPMLITSRPAGYRDDYFSRDTYPHYSLQPFDDTKLDQFIDQWYGSRVGLEAERERRKASLRKALLAKPRIKRLARNPLLLTIIALIHRYKANLPKQRHELYNSAVETLISTWDDNKELTEPIFKVLQFLDFRDIRRLMEQLAYWVHTQGAIVDEENGIQIERNTLIRQLGKFIQTIKAPQPIQLYQAKEEAEAFLDVIIKDRAGLLSQQGKDRYAFVHKTFQEYLCAQEILYRQENQDPDDDDYVPHVKQHITKHLHDQHWREVVLLVVAQQAPAPAKSSLKTILKAESEYEPWLHRDVLFAGSCLAENANVADAGVINAILSELVRLEASNAPIITAKLRQEIFSVLTSCQETPFACKAMTLLIDHQDDIDRWRLLKYQGELAPEDAIVILLGLLGDESSDVRSRAAEALGQLGSASDGVVTGLLGLLGDESSDVRSRAAAALGQLGSASDGVVTGLLGLLGDESSNVRSRAAAALGQLGSASDGVVTGLLGLLGDEASAVRYSAAAVLVQLGSASDGVVTGLLGLLGDESSDVRSRAAAALVQLGSASDGVVTGLLGLLGDESSDVRSRAAAALVQLGSASDGVVTGLLGLLGDEASAVRSRAAAALVQLGSASDGVVTGLLGLLGDEASDVRSRAAAALVQLGSASDGVVTGLLGLLGDESSDVRSRAAAALVQLGSASDGVVTGLLGLLGDEASDVRSRAAAALGQLGSASDGVVTGLLGLLGDEASDVRSRAAAALGQLGSASDGVVTGLLGLLGDEASDVRSRAAAALGQLGSASDGVVTGLLGLLGDESWAISLGIFDTISNHAKRALVTLGKRSIDTQVTLGQWIQQNQDKEFVGKGIDVLWDLNY